MHRPLLEGLDERHQVGGVCHLVKVFAIVAPGLRAEVALVVGDVAVSGGNVGALCFPNTPVSHRAMHEHHENTGALFGIGDLHTIDFDLLQSDRLASATRAKNN